MPGTGPEQPQGFSTEHQCLTVAPEGLRPWQVAEILVKGTGQVPYLLSALANSLATTERV